MTCTCACLVSCRGASRLAPGSRCAIAHDVHCAYCYPHDCHACHGTGFRDAEHGDEPEEGMSCLRCDGSGSMFEREDR